MSRVSDLYRLQEIDLEIDKLNVRLDEIESILQDSSETQRLGGLLSDAERELRSATSAAQGAEHAVQSQREKIERTDAKLYGGSVTNPKELQDLQAESESLKRYLETLEDRYLEAMLENDEAQQAYDQLEQQLERATAEQALTHSGVVEERGQIGKRLEDLRSAREAALSTVEGDDQQTYMVLRERIGGTAIAIVEQDSCSACGLTLSASVRQLVRAGGELVKCSQCHRLLYGG